MRFGLAAGGTVVVDREARGTTTGHPCVNVGLQGENGSPWTACGAAIHGQAVDFGPADDGCHVAAQIIRDALPPIYTVAFGGRFRHAVPAILCALGKERCEEGLAPGNTNSHHFTPMDMP